MAKITRTRFAPSPTGYMHIGNLRTALYTYLIAKKDGGKFVLRIEDTDRERLVDGATEVIYKTLKETGLIWDEGPDIGGDFGPYIQSERQGMYIDYAKKLIETGHAYYCFCEKERIEELRLIHEASKMPHKYDRHCLNLSKEEIEEKLNNGAPYVIRQKIPEGETVFNDVIFGEIKVQNDTLDDQILIKADGFPTYNFANVIDDHLMEITHVVRGNEYLSSAPKYNLLYEAFGWEVPTYVHCSPVMKDAHNKLSKRNGDASYEDLIEKGYLKEAVINYIALLGWAPKGENEKFTLKELEEEFSIDGISKSPAIFDIKKLGWLNSEYIKELSDDEFFEISKPYLDKAIKNESIDKKKVAELLKSRTEVLSEIPEKIDFFDSLPDYDTSLYCHKKMKTNEENSLVTLKEILPIYEGIDSWTFENIHDKAFELISKMDVKNGIVLWPIRTALSGKAFTPGGAFEIAEILGKEESLKRIREGINLLENK